MTTPRRAIIWDSEFLTDYGAPQRFWCGPDDPDPTLVQLGAVAVDLQRPFALGDRFSQIVQPVDRSGHPVTPTAAFIKLTGIDADRIAADGVPLDTALSLFDAFCGETPIWSWGKDEFHAIAISCYVSGIPTPMAATRFGNAVKLLLRAGVPPEDLVKLRSNTMLAYFDLPDQGEQGHDALGDAQSVARVLQHLLRAGRLTPADFAVR